MVNILLCLDWGTLTEKLLQQTAKLLDGFKAYKIKVLHIVDEQAFYPTTGFEVAMGAQLESECAQLETMAKKYLGAGLEYYVEHGIPKLKMTEMLDVLEHDLLVAGFSNHTIFGIDLAGTVADHLIHISKKPVLIIK
jgi:nucleotide-binding universal stress UspA family protein